nr:TPA_asm: hypothetical protein HUJ06_001486 [Nelumbo nucifera]
MTVPKMDFSPIDFRSTYSTWVRFPRTGLRCLSAGTVTDFEWKDYGPAVFRHLQELDNIDYDEYMLSICGYETLKSICSSGKNNKLLYLPHDGRFVIKPLRKSEMKVLLEMLPTYFHHVQRYGKTLLNKIYGLHVVRPDGGIKAYFSVMRNIFHSDLCIHKRFALKGSSQRRSCSRVVIDEATTFKDQDLDFVFYLDPSTRHQVLTQIKHDCEFLEAAGIMGYSFLLGLHVGTPCQDLEGSPTQKNSLLNEYSRTCEEQVSTPDNNYQQPHTHRPNNLGVEMPARAVRLQRNETHPKVNTRECYNVFLYFGIINTFQGYNVLKRIEHAYKSIQYDSRSISAVNPGVYSTRFQDFLCKVFPIDDSDFQAVQTKETRDDPL